MQKNPGFRQFLTVFFPARTWSSQHVHTILACVLQDTVSLLPSKCIRRPHSTPGRSYFPMLPKPMGYGIVLTDQVGNGNRMRCSAPGCDGFIVPHTLHSGLVGTYLRQLVHVQNNVIYIAHPLKIKEIAFCICTKRLSPLIKYHSF